MTTRWEQMNSAEQMFCIELSSDRGAVDWISETVRALVESIPERSEVYTPGQHIMFGLSEALKQRYLYDLEPEGLPLPYQAMLEAGLAQIDWRNAAWGLMPEETEQQYPCEL